jgi:hypothetical protein
MSEEKRGGFREGSGRKPKADEIKVAEEMDAVLIPKAVWQALAEKVKEGDGQCIKTWLSYRYGMPKQSTDITTNGDNINILPIEWVE